MLGNNAQGIGDATFQSIQERKVYAPALNLVRNVMDRNNGYVWVIATGTTKKLQRKWSLETGSPTRW